MAEGASIELTIILEILRYLRIREEKVAGSGLDPGIISALSALPPGVSIGSLISNVTNLTEEVVVGDKYEVGQAGAVGPQSLAIGQQFQQIWNKSSTELDLPSLATELGLLRDSAKASTSGAPEDDLVMAELAHAQIAAKGGDGPKTLSHLARAGQWALDIAQQIGVPIATQAIKAAMGL